MNTYEKTAQEMKRQSEGPKRFAKQVAPVAAIAAATAASSFAPLLMRAAPFLSNFIPEDLAIKGLSKISPKFGKFVKGAMNEGFDFSEIKDFIGNKINESSESKTKEDRNIIKQYSPELDQFISDEVSKGRPPIEAAAYVQHNKKFKDIINKMTKDHKTTWSSIVESIYGTGQNEKQTIAEEAMNPPGSLPSGQPSAELQAFTGNSQQQPGQGLDPAVAQLLQQGNQILNKVRGNRG